MLTVYFDADSANICYMQTKANILPTNVDEIREKLLRDNIRRLRVEHNYTLDELSQKIGIHKSTLSQYENGTRKPSYKAMHKIADFYEMQLDELYGSMSVSEPITVYGVNQPKRNVYIIDREANAGASTEDQNPIKIVASAYFPFLPPGKYYGLAAVGDNMAPNIMPDDYVICEEISRDQFVNDAVYVAVTRSGINIKRLRLIESKSDEQYGKIALMSDNDRVSTWFLDPDDIVKLFKVTDVITRRKL